MIAESTFEFLRKLSRNNNREWFQANKTEYEAVRQNFVDFADKFLDELKATDPALYDTQIKDCIFRIYRDVRFSKDKSPYKLHFSAAFGAGGRKSGKSDYYLHIQDHGSFLGGGFWNPTREELAILRQEIDYSPMRIKDIIYNPKFKSRFPAISGDQLVRAPKGYSEDHPDIDLLKYKEMFFMRTYSNEEVKSRHFLNTIVEDAKLLKPFLDYLNELINND